MPQHTHREPRLFFWKRVFRNWIEIMEREPVELVARWSVSAGILYLISTGQVSGTWGVAAVALIMTLDLERFVRAYKTANYE